MENCGRSPAPVVAVKLGQRRLPESLHSVDFVDGRNIPCVDGPLLARACWCCHEELVGSAHVSGLFARREHRWPSCYPQDQLPIKSTRSRRSGINGFCRSPVVDRLPHDLTYRPFQLHEARPDGPAYCYAACATGSRYSPPRVISTHAIRAILLAMATAAILLLRRCNSLSSQRRLVP